jgi:hypothetical protein
MSGGGGGGEGGASGSGGSSPMSFSELVESVGETHALLSLLLGVLSTCVDRSVALADQHFARVVQLIQEKAALAQQLRR